MDLDEEIMKGGGILGSIERLGDRIDKKPEPERAPVPPQQPQPAQQPASIRAAVKGKKEKPVRGTGEAKSSQPPRATRKKDGLSQMLMRMGLSEKDARTAEKMILAVLLGVLVYFLLRSYGIIG